MFLKILAQAIRIYRAAAMMIFILFYAKVPNEVLSLLLITALLSDLLDDYLAEKLKFTTTSSRLLGLFSGRYLNCISVIFLMVREYPVLPLIIILTKEIFILSFRDVEIDGTPVITTNRVLGGVMSAALWFAVFCNVNSLLTGKIYPYIVFLSIVSFVHVTYALLSNARSLRKVFF